MSLPEVLHRGGIGAGFVLNGATFEASDWRPPETARSITFFVRTQVGGTIRIRRISDASEVPEAQAVANVTVTDPPPVDESIIKIDAPPLGAYRVFFDNTAAVGGYVSIEATWEGA